MDKKQNVVFVITDDQGYGDLCCHGNDIIQTPNLDRLHSESICFTDYHVGPTCAPTRAGLLTGHYHNSTGVWHTIGGRSLLRRDEISLANIFRNNGYRTGIFGKWHLGDTHPYRPQDRGFEEAVVHGGGGVGQTPDYWGNDYFDDTYFDLGEPKKFEGYCTDVFFGLARDFINRHREEPFFCYIPTNAPHSPYQVPEQYANLYRGKVPEDRACFYGMITNIDENVGKLRRWLENENLAENTIFIFMTDNGTSGGCDTDFETHFITDGYNAGMRGKKVSPYEGGHRVPFFLHWPAGGYTKGKDIEELCANVDFLPTMMELCALDAPKDLKLDGTSLVPLMKGEKWHHAQRIIVTDSQRVVNPVKWKDSSTMEGKWRLIRGEELYDVSHDLQQEQDISKEYPEVMYRLRAGYEEWWARVSQRFDEEIPICIGAQKDHVVCINAHDWRGDMEDVAWNQGEIRAAKKCNSYVEISVEQDGLYSFELRRWPREEDRRICDGIEGKLDGWFSGGVPIPVRTARISIGNHKDSAAVTNKEKYIIFEAELEKGPTHLQTWFEDENGNVRGAYYVYVKRL